MAAKNAARGAKKGRRFNRPRSDKAKRLCAERKDARRLQNFARKVANNAKREMGIPTAWEAAKAARRNKRG